MRFLQHLNIYLALSFFSEIFFHMLSVMKNSRNFWLSTFEAKAIHILKKL